MTQELPVGKPKRRNTRERIIDEAEGLAAHHGIEHLKLQDIADRIGIKLPSVYAHFSGREDILSAMGARVNAAFNRFYRSQPEETALETLIKGARDVAGYLVDHPAHFRLILRDLSVPLGYDAINRRYSLHVGGLLPADMADLMNRLQVLLERAVEEDQTKAVSAIDFVSTVHGAALLKLSFETFISPETLTPVGPTHETMANAIQAVALALLGKKRV